MRKKNLFSKKDLNELLSFLNLSSNEIIIYNTLLTHGTLSITQLTKFSKLPRTTAFENAQKLLSKELIIENIEGRRRLLMLADPVKISFLLEKEKSVLTKKIKELEFFDKKSIYLVEELRGKYSGQIYSKYKPLEVAIAIVEKGDEVLLVRRRLSEGKLMWQFPAGRVRYGENASERAVKECYAETNIKCKVNAFLGKRIHPETRAILSYWVCEYISGEIKNKEREENSQSIWVSRSNVLKLFTSDIYEKVEEYFSFDRRF